MSDSRDSARHTTTTPGHHSGTSPTDAIRTWPTPNARISSDGETREDFEARRETLKEKHYNGNGAGMPLAIAIQHWPTPSATVANDGESIETWEGRAQAVEEKWQPGNGVGMPLAIAIQQWPTPMARDHRSGKTVADYGNARPLNEAVLSDRWAMTTAAEAARGPGHSGREGSPNLTTQQSKLRNGGLNPDWVEALMGVPPGWTAIPTGFVSALRSTLAALGLKVEPIRAGTRRRRAQPNTNGSRPAPPRTGGSGDSG